MEVRGKRPQIGKDGYVAPTATLIGDVTLGDRVTVWFNAVIRGDVTPIVIGNETNIQDNVVIHGTYQKASVKIGHRVTVGHSVILHGCTVEDRCLIGMGSILMDHSLISEKSIVAAGSLVTENAKFPPGVLILGRPAKAVRKLTPEEMAGLEQSANNYLFYKGWYENSANIKGEFI